MKYDNLKDKTIFDFTDDPKIIDDIIVSREDYLSRLTPFYRYDCFAELAKITNDENLKKAAEEQFKDVIKFEDEGDW